MGGWHLLTVTVSGSRYKTDCQDAQKNVDTSVAYSSRWNLRVVHHSLIPEFLSRHRTHFECSIIPTWVFAAYKVSKRLCHMFFFPPNRQPAVAQLQTRRSWPRWDVFWTRGILFCFRGCTFQTVVSFEWKKRGFRGKSGYLLRTAVCAVDLCLSSLWSGAQPEVVE